MVDKLESYYLICASPRVGSTLFCHLLAASGIAGTPNEVFDPWNRRNVEKQFSLMPGNLPALLRFALLENRTPNGVGGAKIMWEHLSPLLDDLASLPEFQGFDFPLDRFRAIFSDTKFLHLTRRNLVRSAISYWMAAQTGQWVWYGQKKQISVDSVDYLSITLRHADLHAAAIGWPLFFKQAGLTVPTLYYEDWTKNPLGQVTALANQYLGIDLTGRIPDDFSMPTKQANSLTDEIEREWIRQTGGCPHCATLMLSAPDVPIRTAQAV